MDFLENLAAIIRGSKEYFDFRKSSLKLDAQNPMRTKVQEIEKKDREDKELRELNQTLEEAITTTEEKISPFLASAKVHFTQNQYDDAIRDAGKVLEIEPNDAFALDIILEFRKHKRK